MRSVNTSLVATLLLATLSLNAIAVELKASASGTQVTGEIVNPDAYCGVEISFGDGESAKLRLENDSKQPFNHTYARAGSYTLNAKGVYVSRGLKSAGACPKDATLQIQVGEATASNNTPANTNTPDIKATRSEATPSKAAVNAPEPRPAVKPQGDDLYIYITNRSQYTTVKKLDGSRNFAEPLKIRGTQHFCPITLSQSYDNNRRALLVSATPELLGSFYKDMGVTERLNFEAKNCLDINGNNVWIERNSEILLVQKSAVAQLNSQNALNGFEPVGTLAFADVQLAIEKVQKANQEETQAQATRQAEFNSLAATKSKEKIAAVSLSYPKSNNQSLSLCTRKGGPDFDVPAAGYFATKGLRLSKGFIDAAVKTNSRTPDRQRPFQQVFNDLDAFYVAWQKNKEVCQVYVDYPDNIKTFLDAAKRDGLTQFEINPLVEVALLKANWAQLQGYSDFAEYEFSKEVSASADLLKSLKTFDISNSASFNASAQKMMDSGYAKERNARTLLAYLQDDAEGKKKGQSAKVVKAAREEAEAKSAAAISAAQQAERQNYAKKYPYYAVLSCGFGNNNMALIACFSGGSVDSELKLRQGNVEQVYKVYQLMNNQVGRMQQDGLYIDLQPGFALRAQNASDTLTLTLRVYDRATNKLKVQKQAGSQWAVVSDSD